MQATYTSYVHRRHPIHGDFGRVVGNGDTLTGLVVGQSFNCNGRTKYQTSLAEMVDLLGAARCTISDPKSKFSVLLELKISSAKVALALLVLNSLS